MKILCVCSQGINRSPTLSRMLKLMGHEAIHCGIMKHWMMTNELVKELDDWADVVVFMEMEHKKEYEKYRDTKNKTLVMGIPDKYIKDSEELIDLINNSILWRFLDMI